MDNVCAVVVYEYAAKEPDELDLHKGAIIQAVKQLPGGWWQGTLKASGKTGMFPDNFVRLLEPQGSAHSNGSSNGNHSDDSAAVQLRDKGATSNRRCKVIYSYTQVNDDELTLAVGDVIEFLGEVEEGWWRGRLRSKVGVFPSNFVQHIESSPILASKRPPAIGATVTTNSLTAKAANITGIIKALPDAAAANTAATTTTTTTKQQINRRANTAANTADITGNGTTAAAEDAAAPILPPKPLRDYCRVEYPYAPQNDDELELKVNDIITVISMDLADKGWWKGELRGKVGVFPDNFVKLMTASEVAPLNETPQQTQRKPNNTIANATASLAAATTSSHMTTTTTNTATQQSKSSSNTTTTTTTTTTNNTTSSSSATTSKVYIKKSGSSSRDSSNRKDSFGSRDSLNDILSETGLPSGNVAAQRKSLENKNLDLSKKQSNTTITTNTTNTAASSTAISTTAAGMASAELRKSLDSLDDKTKSPPPPVLSKKPSVPLKKTPTGTAPAGSILSGFKKKSDTKLTSSVSHDLADGVGSSRLSSGQLPDAGATGTHVVMRRSVTLAGEDVEFDSVERASILTDMRAGRVKAPKRRPPSAALNVLGESNNNSVYVNGSGSELSEEGPPATTASSDDNSTGEEQLAKPKPREWEKKKAPWMEELKATQVKKKTSPNVEPRAVGMAERSSKLFAAEQSSTTTSSNSSSSSTITSSTTKVQSAAVTSSSIMQQSMYVESSQKKESTAISSSSSNSSNSNAANISNSNDAIMSKSLSAKQAAASSDEESRVVRPNSLSIRNRSISPLVKSASSSTQSNKLEQQQPASSSSNASPATVANSKSSTMLNNHHHSDAKPSSGGNVQELERRIDKLETVVQAQQRTIDELVRALRDEAEHVKLLRGELDKYAQCVTQV